MGEGWTYVLFNYVHYETYQWTLQRFYYRIRIDRIGKLDKGTLSVNFFLHFFLFLSFLFKVHLIYFDERAVAVVAQNSLIKAVGHPSKGGDKDPS